jgi:hypothetical protein
LDEKKLEHHDDLYKYFDKIHEEAITAKEKAAEEPQAVTLNRLVSSASP